VCKFLYFIILCPIIYLDYFWCIKYYHLNIYVKMGKRKEKRKRRRDFQPAGPRGGGGFRPSRRERARGRAFGPVGPAARGDGGGRRHGAGPTRQGEGVADDVNGTEKGGGLDRGPAGSESRCGSPSWVRFFGGEAVAKHGRVKGVTGVGRILPMGAYGGRSATRWRVPAAVMPPVRLPSTIEWEKWRPVIVRVWRSFEHSLIGQRIAREGEGSSPER
jgi:hypothetical protein